MPTAVGYTVAGGVARLTLDTPHNRNALSSALVSQLRSRLVEAGTDPSVRLVVLGHTGGTFCAGADLGESAGGEAAGGDPAQAAVDRGQALAALLRAIVAAPLPVVGVVDGHVRAGGFGLVGACDIVIAGPRSTFALTEARLGVAPAIITLTLQHRVAPRALSRYYLTGETFGSAEAAAIGLATVAAEDVGGALDAVVADLLRGSPQGLAESKKLTTAALLEGFDQRAEELCGLSARLFASEEAREGMMAFLQKRPPRWVPDLGPPPGR